MRTGSKLLVTLPVFGISVAAAILWSNPAVRARAQRLFNITRSRFSAATSSELPIAPQRPISSMFAQIPSVPRAYPRSNQLAPTDADLPGVLELDGDNLTITQRVRSELGRVHELADLPHLNINTENRGVVYLRGYVHTEQQRRMAEDIARRSEGVTDVINEITIERAINL